MDKFKILDGYCVGVCDNSGIEYKFSEEDLPKIQKHHWWSQASGVYTHIGKKTVSLARFILDINEHQKKVLRRNKDTFDYRRQNLYYGNIYTADGSQYNVECFDGRKFIISAASYNLVKEQIWHIDKNNYVITKLKSGRVIKLHRLLLGVVDKTGVEVDHINRDTLDNRIENLRLADRSLNSYNRDVSKYNESGKIGVYKMHGYDDKWCAQINVGGKRLYLGSYDSFEGASKARMDAEALYY